LPVAGLLRCAARAVESCNFHPSGYGPVPQEDMLHPLVLLSALTFRLISLVGVKWSYLRIMNKPFSPEVPGEALVAVEFCKYDVSVLNQGTKLR